MKELAEGLYSLGFWKPKGLIDADGAANIYSVRRRFRYRLRKSELMFDLEKVEVRQPYRYSPKSGITWHQDGLKAKSLGLINTWELVWSNTGGTLFGVFKNPEAWASYTRVPSSLFIGDDLVRKTHVAEPCEVLLFDNSKMVHRSPIPLPEGRWFIRTAVNEWRMK